MIVYVDVLFLLNFIIDLLLIYVTSVISRSEIHTIRLLAAASMGALYSVIMFFPDVDFIKSGVLRLLFSIILVMFAFKTYKPKKAAKLVFIFYMSSFIFGGAVFGIVFLTSFGQRFGAVLSNGELYLNLNVGILLALTAAIYVGMMYFTKIFRRNYSKDTLLKKLIIKAFDEEIEVIALIDTGCELCDPTSQKAAMIIESSVLPQTILEILGDNQEKSLSEIYESYDLKALKNGLRYLPFSSIGCESGYIKCFTAEKIELEDSEYCISDKSSVGVVGFDLTKDGLYKAIINPDMLKKREENCNYANGFCEFFKNKSLFFKACFKSKTGNKGLLHRRKRYSAATLEPRGGKSADCGYDKRN